MNTATFPTLARLFVAACVGSQEDVAAAVALARAEGVPPLQVDETLLLVVAYAGVPRAILAFRAWRDIEPTATAQPSVNDRPAAGGAVFDAVYGDRAPRIRRELAVLHPELHAAIIEDAYGRILARTGLSPVDRELLAVAMLVALRAPRQTAAHAIGARRAGASADAIARAAEFAAPYVSADEVVAAVKLIAQVIGPQA